MIREDTRVLRPDGEVLLVFRRKAIGFEVCKQAYHSLRSAATTTNNRGNAGGVLYDEAVIDGNRPVAERSKTRYRSLKEDGTVSRTNRARPVESGIIGYFDRNPRFPYCRLTAFNLDEPEKFAAAIPFFQAVDAVFAREVPERYAAQRAFIARTNPDFYIHGTVFTTVTVNRNWQTAVHKDAGDLAEGFGVLSVLQAGQYEGGLFVLPKWRIAVDIRSTDVLLADVHQWHGNTAIVGDFGRYERISCVFYYRQFMERCGSAAEELTAARRRKAGEPLNKKRRDE